VRARADEGEGEAKGRTLSWIIVGALRSRAGCVAGCWGYDGVQAFDVDVGRRARASDFAF
jgi:hypothetical protein